MNKDGEYYKDKIGYAMKLYSIFICFKCQQPYYGGLNNCIDDEKENEDDDNDYSARDYVINVYRLQSIKQNVQNMVMNISNGNVNFVVVLLPFSVLAPLIFVSIAIAKHIR